MRRKILEAAFLAGEGHIASAYSVLEVIAGIYSHQIFRSNEASKFLLSKGHASLALYSVLNEMQLIPDSWVQNFCKIDSDFGGHPDSSKIPEIEISSGSLGHGLPIAVGYCLSQRATDKSGDIIVLVGDGELNEGSNWESLMVAAHHKLNNLHIFVDFNHSGDRAISLGNLPEKFASFGCDVREIDGHDISKVQAEMDRKSERVKVTIANTIKGFGIREMESNPEWHHKVPNKIQFKAFLEQLS